MNVTKTTCSPELRLIVIYISSTYGPQDEMPLNNGESSVNFCISQDIMETYQHKITAYTFTFWWKVIFSHEAHFLIFQNSIFQWKVLIKSWKHVLLSWLISLTHVLIWKIPWYPQNLCKKSNNLPGDVPVKNYIPSYLDHVFLLFLLRVISSVFFLWYFPWEWDDHESWSWMNPFWIFIVRVKKLCTLMYIVHMC